jgi:hypothetical protein
VLFCAFGEDSEVIYIFVALFFFPIFLFLWGEVLFFFGDEGRSTEVLHRRGKAADGHRSGFSKGVGVACQD